jgi:entry exclusion lipoprotein TrbK
MKQIAADAKWAGSCRFAGAVLLASLLAGCWSDTAPTGSVSKCVAENFPSYNPRDRDQCIAACIKCEKGVTTTCATACSLKGNR